MAKEWYSCPTCQGELKIGEDTGGCGGFGQQLHCIACGAIYTQINGGPFYPVGGFIFRRGDGREFKEADFIDSERKKKLLQGQDYEDDDL